MHHCGLSAHSSSQYPVAFLVKEAGREGVPRGAISILDSVVLCLQFLSSTALFCCPGHRQPLGYSFVHMVISCVLIEIEHLALLAPEVHQNPAALVGPASRALDSGLLSASHS